MKNLFTFLFFLSINFFSIGQIENQSQLKIAEIMKGKDFIGYWPENHYWDISGENILFQWNPNNELTSTTYSYNLKNQKITSVDFNNPLSGVSYNSSQSQFDIHYFVLEGNLWAYNNKTKTHSELISSTSYISRIHRQSNPSEIAYQQGLDLFLYNNEKGTIRQLTQFVKGSEKDQNHHELNALSQQQEQLFQYIREEKELDEWSTSKEVKKNKNLPFYLDKSNLDFVQISKDGQTIFFSTSTSTENKSTYVEHHITRTGYTESQQARPKVGEIEPFHNLYIYKPGIDSIIKVNFDKLEDIRKKPIFLSEYGDQSTEYEQNRKIVFHRPHVSFSGVTVLDIRSYDNKDRWIIQLENDGSFHVISHQHDEAWIGGPGISSWNQSPGNMGFWNNEQSFYYQSEESGYSHLYSYDFKNKSTEQLTSGLFEIQDVILSKDEKTFYFKANKSHPGNQGFYKFNPFSKEWTNILTEEGAYDVLLSPDEKSLAILYSNKNSPWELFYAKNIKDTKPNRITHSLSDDYKKYSWREPRVILFKGGDGKTIHARLYEPTEIKKNQAAVLFVHGAGYLQNAHNYWSSYYREYMFHNLLVDNGYTVLDIDFRASSGYGRDFRTDIYRHMGGLDLSDNLSGKKLLVDSLNIDPEKVGIYGGSYGGFITLMALLTEPDEFACGAALRSVTDWMHYNHEYTSNILNYPSNDSIAYYRSSPINFAKNLKKPLLMLHGMVDDNVQFQDVVRLSQRFIELGKTNWDLAVFPVEAHGFIKPYSWSDEYRRIFELFEKELLNK